MRRNAARRELEEEDGDAPGRYIDGGRDEWGRQRWAVPNLRRRQRFRGRRSYGERKSLASSDDVTDEVRMWVQWALAAFASPTARAPRGGRACARCGRRPADGARGGAHRGRGRHTGSGGDGRGSACFAAAVTMALRHGALGLSAPLSVPFSKHRRAPAPSPASSGHGPEFPLRSPRRGGPSGGPSTVRMTSMTYAPRHAGAVVSLHVPFRHSSSPPPHMFEPPHAFAAPILSCHGTSESTPRAPSSLDWPPAQMYPTSPISLISADPAVLLITQRPPSLFHPVPFPRPRSKSSVSIHFLRPPLSLATNIDHQQATTYRFMWEFDRRMRSNLTAMSVGHRHRRVVERVGPVNMNVDSGRGHALPWVLQLREYVQLSQTP